MGALKRFFSVSISLFKKVFGLPFLFVALVLAGVTAAFGVMWFYSIGGKRDELRQSD